MLGERNCGKGVLQELDQATFGGYVNTINANGFLLQQHAAQDAAKSMSWALDCEHSRLTNTNEVAFESVEALVEHADRLITAIFASDYGVQLEAERDILWLISPQATKVSLHVVVCTHAPLQPLS